ncbi:MAG: PTS sugar transporter subunit IIA [Sandaracinaceae bacterium]
MKLSDILTPQRVDVRDRVADKPASLRALAELLERGADDVIDASAIAAVLAEREALASTGVGSGVAVPHGRAANLPALIAALLIVRDGVEFESIDGLPAHIFVALLGPKNLEHIKALGRVSRVLRSEAVRAELLAAPDAQTAFDVLIRADGG